MPEDASFFVRIRLSKCLKESISATNMCKWGYSCKQDRFWWDRQTLNKGGCAVLGAEGASVCLG